jgi:hypothetical protein
MGRCGCGVCSFPRFPARRWIPEAGNRIISPPVPGANGHGEPVSPNYLPNRLRIGHVASATPLFTSPQSPFRYALPTAQVLPDGVSILGETSGGASSVPTDANEVVWPTSAQAAYRGWLHGLRHGLESWRFHLGKMRFAEG